MIFTICSCSHPTNNKIRTNNASLLSLPLHKENTISDNESKNRYPFDGNHYFEVIETIYPKNECEKWVDDVKFIKIKNYFYLLDVVYTRQLHTIDTTKKSDCIIKGKLKQHGNDIFDFEIHKDLWMKVIGNKHTMYFTKKNLDVSRVADSIRNGLQMNNLNYYLFRDQVSESMDKSKIFLKDYIFEYYKELIDDWGVLYGLAFATNPRRASAHCDNFLLRLIPDKNGFLHRDYPDRRDLLFCLWQNMDKSPKNIQKFFDERTKDYMFKYFNYSDNENDPVHPLVRSLLITYDEIGKNKKLLKELYLRADSISPIEDRYYAELASPELKEAMSWHSDGYLNYYTVDSWPYSFWVRRNKEGNKEVIYALLKEFEKRAKQ